MTNLNLTNQKIKNTYQNLVQHYNKKLYDGLGNQIEELDIIGLRGSDGISLSTFIPKNPNGVPEIQPGYIKINTALDSVSTIEHFNSTICGLYFQTMLPYINEGEKIALGLCLNEELVYYAVLNNVNSELNLSFYIYDNLINKITYNEEELLSIYANGVNVYYIINGEIKKSIEQDVHGLMNCSIIINSLYTEPVEFKNILFYPTGIVKYEYEVDENVIPKFDGINKLINSSIVDTNSLVEINNNVKINGKIIQNSITHDNVTNDTELLRLPIDIENLTVIDYLLKNNQNNSLRGGTLYVIWSSNGSYKYSEIRTEDIDGDTSDFIFNFLLDNNNIVIKSIITNDSTYNVKLSIRIL